MWPIGQRFRAAHYHYHGDQQSQIKYEDIPRYAAEIDCAASWLWSPDLKDDKAECDVASNRHVVSVQSDILYNADRHKTKPGMLLQSSMLKQYRNL
jgi:hypothetical protein